MRLDCYKPENHTPAKAIGEAMEAIHAVHRGFGAPGDFGYGTREGAALQWLYSSLDMLGVTLKVLDPEELTRRVDAIRRAEEEPRLPSALRNR
jgi:hypothetical protein